MQETNKCVLIKYVLSNINLLKPTGYFTFQQVSNSKILQADSIAFTCFVRISKQTAIFALNALTGFCNRGGECLQRGTD
jgi:hypothetical protein